MEMELPAVRWKASLEHATDLAGLSAIIAMIDVY
jgi:hypothetical protein